MSWWHPHGETAVAPSLLSADFGAAAQEMASMEAAGADIFHLDIMDGHFVPNLTFGPFIAEALRRRTDKPFDAHLMVTRPDTLVEPFARAGVNALTFHVESDADTAATLRAIRGAGLHPGLSLRPGTDLAALEPHLVNVDLVLVMSVEPGFGGQEYRPEAPERIAALARRRRELGAGFAISVDGGLNARTARLSREAGADIMVAGSYLFGAEDRAAAVASLRGP